MKNNRVYIILIILLIIGVSFVLVGKRLEFIDPSDSKNKIIDVNFVQGEEDVYLDLNSDYLEGTLITKLYYGVPNYGENPETDQKEYPYILVLDEPIKVKLSSYTDDSRETIEISEIQLVPIEKNIQEYISQNLDEYIKIQGSFFRAMTGHHHTEILFEVKKVLD